MFMFALNRDARPAPARSGLELPPSFLGISLKIRGVIEAEGPLLAWALTRCTLLDQGASAITFGHVVLAVNAAALEATRAHERVHVRQYERWGPLFIPLYLAEALWATARGRHAYFDNRFEREAREG